MSNLIPSLAPAKAEINDLAPQTPDGTALDLGILEVTGNGDIVFGDPGKPVLGEIGPAGVADEDGDAARFRLLQPRDGSLGKRFFIEEIADEDDVAKRRGR